jgi:hypothetical protein
VLTIRANVLLILLLPHTSDANVCRDSSEVPWKLFPTGEEGEGGGGSEGVVEIVAKVEVGEGVGEVGALAIEVVAKSEVGEAGGKAGDILVEVVAKGEVGEGGGKVGDIFVEVVSKGYVSE